MSGPSPPLTLYYFARMAFPHGAAHAIQTVDNCAALAEGGCDVFLFNGRRRGWSVARGLEYYGVPPHERLHVLPVPCLTPGEALFRSRQAHVLWAALVRRRFPPPGPACIFVRQIPVAALLLRRRRLCLWLNSNFVREEVISFWIEKKKRVALPR